MKTASLTRSIRRLVVLVLVAFVVCAESAQAREVVYVRLTDRTKGLTPSLKQSGRVIDSKRLIPVVADDKAFPRSPVTRWVRMEARDADEADQMLKELRDDPAVEVAERMPQRTTCGLPGSRSPNGLPLDPLSQFQWYLDAVNAWAAWDRVPDASSVTVAILDNGCDMAHPDLTSAFWTNEDEANGRSGVDDDNNGYVDDVHGWDFFENDSNPNAPNEGSEPSHGTHCAGIVGATVNNGIGIAGMAPGVRLMIVRIGEDRSIYYPVEGMIYAAANGADVISMSFSGELSSVFERDAVDFATSRGVVLLAAAGNDGSTSRNYPAAYENVVAVGATDPTGALAYFSNRGDWVDLAAPGTGILSTSIQGYKYLDGTSMATPLTAGIAALVRAQDPSADPAVVRARIGQGAVPLTVSPSLVVSGRVDAWRSSFAGRPTVIVNGASFEDENGNGLVEPGETVTMMLDAELAGESAASLIVGLESRETSLVVSGEPVTLSPVSIGALSLSPLEFLVTSSAARGNHDLYLTIDADGWSDSQRLTVPVDPHWRTHDAGGMIASVTDFGAIGYRDLYNNRDDAEGIRLNGASRGFLFHGSVLVSDGAHVSDCAYGNDTYTRFDFQNIDTDPIRPVGSVAGTQVFRAKYTDFGVTPRVGVEVTQTTTSQTEGSNVVRMDLDVRKWDTGTASYDVGLYMDWDIGDAEDNDVRFNSNLKLSYMIGSEGAGGVMVVDNTQNPTPLIAAAAIYNPAVLYQTGFDTFTDSEKLDLLEGGTTQAVSSFSGEWSHMIAVNLSGVTEQVSKRASFLILAASDESELLAIATSQAGNTLKSGGSGGNITLVPDRFSLSPAWPNPFNSETRMRLQLTESGNVQAVVYDILGRKVAVLHNGAVQTGTFILRWDGRNEAGHTVASGTYLVRVKGPEGSQLRRITLVR
ncbi:MAG: S8 family serine peptidase [bacterium]